MKVFSPIQISKVSKLQSSFPAGPHLVSRLHQLVLRQVVYLMIAMMVRMVRMVMVVVMVMMVMVVVMVVIIVVMVNW